MTTPYSDVVSDGGMDPRNRDQRPLPTLADLTMMVDDYAERVAAHARLLGGDDHSLSGSATAEAEREAADARVALLAAIGMLTGGEG